MATNDKNGGSNGDGAREASRAESEGVDASEPQAVGSASFPRRLTALARCEHPEAGLTRVTVIAPHREPDGEASTIAWCAGCGALGVVSDAGLSWTQHGLAQTLDREALSRWSEDMDLLAYAAYEVTLALRGFAAPPSELPASARRTWAAEVSEIMAATKELEQAARAAVGLYDVETGRGRE